MKRTQEQQDAVQAVLDYGSVKLEALAGTGKTTALELAARASSARATYITFNRRNAEEAASRFPSNVDCRTAHSLAFKAVGHRFKRRLKLPPPSPRELAQHLKCDRDLLDRGEVQLDADDLAWISWETVRNFIKTPDQRLSKHHLPSAVRDTDRAAVANVVLPPARRIWRDMNAPRGTLPVSHDAYLKIWQLTKPIIAGDVIYFDEAQDADPVMLDVVRRQSAKQVYVGDRFQSIYEWRGAVNAMDEITTEVTRYLTESFRFGQSIADVANEYLAVLGSEVLLTGAARHASRVGAAVTPDVVLCRTNAEAVHGVIRTLDSGLAPCLVGGTKELIAFADAADRLQGGKRPSSGPLARFRTWSEVREYVGTEPEGESQLVSMVRLIDDVGARRLLFALRRCVEEPVADRRFSTGHRAKGREWPAVRLATDFDDVDLDIQEELRLLYVAHTRAQQLLDRSAITSQPRPIRTVSGRKVARSTPRRAEPRADDANRPFSTTSRPGAAKAQPPPASRHGKRWTATEDERLVDAYTRGEQLASIARQLGRTQVSVQDRLVKVHGVDWRGFVDAEPNQPTGRTAATQVQPPAPAQPAKLSNKELAARMRALGHSPTRQPWKAGKALRAAGLPITARSLTASLSVVERLDPDGTKKYEELEATLTGVLRKLATNPEVFSKGGGSGLSADQGP